MGLLLPPSEGRTSVTVTNEKHVPTVVSQWEYGEDDSTASNMLQ